VPQPLWDASALAKRYTLERGSETVDAVFAGVPQSQMITTFLSYAETFSLLWRKHNRGDISLTTFTAAASLLQAETLNSPDFGLLTLIDRDMIEGVEYMRQHNMNASDAAILAAYIRYARAQSFGSSPTVLIAADQRLLRAATAEGIATLNPELVSPTDIPALLAAL